jgi:hypothetical protein
LLELIGAPTRLPKLLGVLNILMKDMSIHVRPGVNQNGQTGTKSFLLVRFFTNT